MGEKSGAARTRTPAKASSSGTTPNGTTTPSLSRKPSSAASSTASKQQKSILGFFTKTPKEKAANTGDTTAMPTSSPCLKESTTKSNSLQLNKRPSNKSNITPVPSSDALEPSSSQENIDSATTVKKAAVIMGSSPSRKVGLNPIRYYFYLACYLLLLVAACCCLVLTLFFLLLQGQEGSELC